MGTLWKRCPRMSKHPGRAPRPHPVGCSCTGGEPRLHEGKEHSHTRVRPAEWRAQLHQSRGQERDWGATEQPRWEGHLCQPQHKGAQAAICSASVGGDVRGPEGGVGPGRTQAVNPTRTERPDGSEEKSPAKHGLKGDGELGKRGRGLPLGAPRNNSTCPTEPATNPVRTGHRPPSARCWRTVTGCHRPPTPHDWAPGVTCSNFQPSDMVDTICVSSSSWHCSTRYTCFTGTCQSESHA